VTIPSRIPDALDASLPLLACPRCGGALAVAASRTGDAAETGARVECRGCGACFPVVDDALDLLESPLDLADPVRKPGARAEVDGTEERRGGERDEDRS
jgi:uncharacterized protein YbaR (Trm112 family)